MRREQWTLHKDECELEHILWSVLSLPVLNDQFVEVELPLEDYTAVLLLNP